MSGTRAISTTSRHELSSRFFLQGKAPKEIHAILTETFVCFLPGQAKNLSAPLYILYTEDISEVLLRSRDQCVKNSFYTITLFPDDGQMMTETV
jgi:hypothetical protein